MPKEMIVSVNGREKKIAIVENGRVTEFYIERGESSQGIVGNIYKGRVMRVLPGMQSAFVDIGLERDAFLYVSDFFDEEEEFERIVVDKKKTEGADDESAARAAAERIERARVERERQIETAHESAEPEEEEGATAEDEPDDAEQAPAAAQAAPARVEEEASEQEEASGRRRDRRGKRRRDRDAEGREGASRDVSPRASAPADEKKSAFPVEDIATPFAAGADSFERIVDEEESAAENGSMFKDARLQERLSDQTRAVEFDIEPTTTAEVGSLLGANASAGGGFERIDDSDSESAAGGGARPRSVRREVASSVAGLIEEVEGEDAFATAQTFERVSDDEKAGTAPDAPVAGKRRGGRGGASRAASKGGAKKSAEQPRTEAASQETAAAEEAPASKKRASGARSTSKAAPRKEATKSSKASGSKGGSKRGKKAGGEGEQVGGTEDADAGVKSRPPRGEFARRGGRRRRKPGGKPDEPRIEGQNGDAEIIADDTEVAEVEAAPAAPPPPPQQPTPVAAAPAPAPATHSGPRGRQREREDNSRGPREREGNRAPREGGRERNSGGERGGERGRGRRERHPTITDLLREGQEIIVQIAKEPIAQKGARITSHIALPGRYLVYMPTIEHVGVSRKIESDSERIRLRKLIQAIVREEDVPSGGFIVRTAGVGISEQDLRDDARYLVRTWRDIRRGAEKSKAPSLAHKDLDLVQRLLRDQLSDDFAAIRVDSEQEYQEVVEFINRIQPRLVNRVKLHTRPEPILEAYGVQTEIDKAIKPRVWLKSGGYLVINQTEALVAIDVNTGKFVGRGGTRLEDTITRTNMEAVDEIARQIRLRDLGGIIVLDLIDMEERRNRARVMQALQDALRQDKSPTKVLSFNDFGLVIMTRKRVKQSLERTLCAPCPYCQGAGLVKSPQTVCYEILEEARTLARANEGEDFKQTTLRVNLEVTRALRSTERDVLAEIEEYLGPVDIIGDEHIHQEQFDFAFI
jgi:ribonuclease G